MGNFIRKTNVFLTVNIWRPVVLFQPILLFFMWGATVRLAVSDSPPPRFEKVSNFIWFYDMWLAMGIFYPMLALASWWMIEKCSGKVRFLGMWARLTSNIGLVTVMISFHLADVLRDKPDISESHIFSRYIMASALCFLCLLVVRDIWTLVLAEKLAKRIIEDLRDDE